MTALSNVNAVSAPTIEWVRTAFARLLAEAGCEKESCLVVVPDEELLADVRAAVNGDGEAYARIISRFQQTIGRRMARFSRDPRVIEELVHDGFVEAYLGLSRYRSDAPLEHWLQRIATRIGYRHWNRRQQQQAISLALDTCDPHSSTAALEQDDADEVAIALERLAPRDRLVLTLLYLESKTIAEAADLAGWSQTMVKVQAFRARKRFRKLLEEMRQEPALRVANNG
jgi:RNA polymerase sigma-70 factor (ECF subfamily)